MKIYQHPGSTAQLPAHEHSARVRRAALVSAQPPVPAPAPPLPHRFIPAWRATALYGR